MSLRLAPIDRRIWLLIVLVLSLLAGRHWRAPILSNDSYQYLSEGANIAHGRGLSTSLIHYDPERRHGTIPAPVTHYPPGYPLLIAAFTKLGISATSGAWWISMLSFATTSWLLAEICALLELKPWAQLVTVLLLVTNAQSILYSDAASTESLFTVFTTAAALSLMRYELTLKTRHALIGGIFAGLAFSTRYAGIFIVFAVNSFYFARWMWRRDRRSAITAFCAAVSLVPTLLIMLRNHFLGTGLTGGGTRLVYHNPYGVIKVFGTSLFHLFYGSSVALQLGIAELLFMAAILIQLVLWARLRWRPLLPACAAPATLVTAVYVAGLLFLGAASDITFGPRMFVPVIPLLLAGVVLIVSQGFEFPPNPRYSSWFAASLIMMCISYVFINARDAATPLTKRPHEYVAEALSSQREWIESHIPKHSVVIASCGQATGYILDRPTVGLVGSEFSGAQWDEATVKAVSTQFGAHYLILYPHMPPDLTDGQPESPFLQNVLQGNTPPWLSKASGNELVTFYEIAR